MDEQKKQEVVTKNNRWDDFRARRTLVIEHYVSKIKKAKIGTQMVKQALAFIIIKAIRD